MNERGVCERPERLTFLCSLNVVIAPSSPKSGFMCLPR